MAEVVPVINTMLVPASSWPGDVRAGQAVAPPGTFPRSAGDVYSGFTDICAGSPLWLPA